MFLLAPCTLCAYKRRAVSSVIFAGDDKLMIDLPETAEARKGASWHDVPTCQFCQPKYKKPQLNDLDPLGSG